MNLKNKEIENSLSALRQIISHVVNKPKICTGTTFHPQKPEYHFITSRFFLPFKKAIIVLENSNFTLAIFNLLIMILI